MVNAKTIRVIIDHFSLFENDYLGTKLLESWQVDKLIRKKVKAKKLSTWGGQPLNFFVQELDLVCSFGFFFRIIGLFPFSFGLVFFGSGSGFSSLDTGFGLSFWILDL